MTVSFIAPVDVLAQQLRSGNMPFGTRMNLRNDPYTVSGETAQEILDQLRSRGPRSWARFPYVYSWRYSNERVPLASGMPSTNCAPTDFQITFDVTATYPRWVPPQDAPPELVDAWAAFTQQLENVWDQAREGMVRRGTAAARRVERFEEQCAFVNQRVREMVVELFDRPPPGMEDVERLGLRWPPAGYDVLLRPAAADLPEDEPELVDSSDPSTAPDAGDPPTRRGPPPRPAPRPAPEVTLVPIAPTLDDAVGADLENGAIGLVIRLDHEGALQFREAFGRSAPEEAESLDPDAEVVFPSFTEVLLAALTAVMAEDGLVDPDAPLSTHLPGLPPGLGATTLSLLLSHRAGLDNAIVPDTADWVEVMERLDDRALFTRPGSIHSYSRYSYPMVARVLEAAGGVSFARALSDRILAPLGMEDTRLGTAAAFDGLPATHTTADDLARFWTAWLDGALPGTGPSRVGSTATALAGLNGRAFVFGSWHDWVDGRQRISLMCGAPRQGYSAGFQVFPSTKTVLVFWARYAAPVPEDRPDPPSPRRWPATAVRFTLSRIGEALRVGDDVYRPTQLDGGGSAAWSAVRCAEPAASERRVEELGAPTPSDAWPGRYLNGEWLFDLVDVDGFLATPADSTQAPFPVLHYGDDVYFARIPVDTPTPVGFPLRLRYDAEGRRYVLLGDRAYLHEGDRPAR